MYCYTLLCVFLPSATQIHFRAMSAALGKASTLALRSLARHFPCYPCFRMKTVWYIRTANDIERRVREGSRPLVSM